MRGFFSAENWLFKPLGVLGDLVILSLLWMVCAIPILTLGPASAALYDTAVHSLRRREDTVLSRFLASFRRELGQGIGSTLIALLAAALFCALTAALFRLVPPERGALALMLLLPPGLLLLGVLCWLWPVQSRFRMGLKALFFSSLRLALGHILRTVPMALLWAVTLALGLRFAAPLFVLPALAALLCTTLIEPVFQQYEKPQAP